MTSVAAIYLGSDTINSARGRQVPTTERRPVSDEYFGTKVTDDYRWLEDWTDPAVRAWSDAQNAYARDRLDGMPGVDAIRERITVLRSAGVASYRLVTGRPSTHSASSGSTESSVEPSTRLAVPSGQVPVFFALKNQPPRQQPLLVILTDLHQPATEKTIVDPIALDPSGLTSIDWYMPAPDGRLVALSLSEGGSERGHLHVFDVASGHPLGDVVPYVNSGTAGGSLGWIGDSSGFYYTRYPRPGERPDAELEFFVEIYFHALGTPTAEDRYEIGKEFPAIGEPRIAVSPDGRTVLVNVQNGDSGEYSQFLRTPDRIWTRLSSFGDRI